MRTLRTHPRLLVTALKMRRLFVSLPVALGVLLLSAACTTGVPASVGSPIAPDPCSPENVEAAVKPLNDLMREFDDYAALASNVVQAELVKVIPPMQTIRRAAQDLVVPGCMADLRRHALAYMDSTLETLLTFQNPNPNVGTLATGIADARSFHQAYALELGRLLAPKLTPAAATAAAQATP